MKLILVRHGRPHEGHPQHPGDPPLHADGWRQARAVAAHLREEGITHVVASPLRRAQQTARPLAELLGLPIDTIDGWAEADRHSPLYRSGETLRALGATEWARFLADPVAYFGGDPAQFRATVLSALSAVLDRPEPQAQVVVFTHGLPINVALSHALGLERMFNFNPGFGSLTRLITREEGRIGVLSINETGHHRWHQEVDA